MSKIAVITGGSRGLGRAGVLNLVTRNIKVIFTYYSNITSAESLVEEIKALGLSDHVQHIRLDASKPEELETFFSDLKAALQKWGTDRFDYFIHNAGEVSFGTLQTLTSKDLDHMYNVHYKSIFLLTQKALDYMNDGGRILIVTAGAARTFAGPLLAYATMKAACETLVLYLAHELGPRGITAIGARVGFVMTDQSKHMAQNEHFLAHVRNSTALKRIATPDDVAPAYAALLSDDLQWANGTILELTGGTGL